MDRPWWLRWAHFLVLTYLYNRLPLNMDRTCSLLIKILQRCYAITPVIILYKTVLLRVYCWLWRSKLPWIPGAVKNQAVTRIWNLPTTWVSLGADPSPVEPLDEKPALTFWLQPCRGPSYTIPRLLTDGNYEIINMYCFKLLNLWSFVIQQYKINTHAKCLICLDLYIIWHITK